MTYLFELDWIGRYKINQKIKSDWFFCCWKRFYQRDLTRKGNYSLNQTAKNAGVKNFDKFHNAGYKGLYNGETADDIAKRKGLRYREDILDNMGSDELISNLFRISQTEQRLKRDKVDTEKRACDTHNKIGKIVMFFKIYKWTSIYFYKLAPLFDFTVRYWVLHWIHSV